MPKQEKIILGIDPGTVVMGYGLIKVEKNKMSLVQFGVLKLAKYPDHYIRLQKIFERTCQLIDEYGVNEVALEAPFFGKNVQSMLKLGRAQGVAMAAALSRQLPVAEYAPKKVKQSVTGNGNSSKEQIALMIKSLLGFEKIPEFLDATDAVAVAICHHYQKKGQGSQKTSWKAFLNDNPNRIIK
jgi:crossover junction endodeoxyribonuclease RuvC